MAGKTCAHNYLKDKKLNKDACCKRQQAYTDKTLRFNNLSALK